MARGASMSPANVYRFFPSRQAIEETVVANLFDRMSAAATLAARGDSALERLTAALRTISQLHQHRAGARQQATRIGRCGGTRELGSRPVLRRPDPSTRACDHCCRTG
ncbi:TetR/AcrR family transcriptional regulator [Bradyrhizobium ivorense]|uniref:TetR/AcrR family transcriptional regulator n=1 Tax=Bradyrhizobium ivorense TaxID=2511166 RepID=UPI003557A1D8